MKISNISSCYCTDKLDACRIFYAKHFDAEINFDCGWYINLKIGESSLQFMNPDFPAPQTDGQGISINIHTEDVDAFHQKLTSQDIDAPAPEDHPWGARSFDIKDPAGINLCIYSDREPSPEYKEAFRE